jgi:hypothetical protein
MEITQHASFTCSFCGKDTMRRQAVGIWHCGGCKKTVAGGAWTVKCVSCFAVPLVNVYFVTWRMGVFVMAANSLFHGHLSFLPLLHLPNRCIMNYFNSMIPHC